MPNTDTSVRRDPIRDTPLREPGQSIRELLDERFDEIVAPWLTIAILTAILAVVEWIRWYTNAPYAPFLVTAVAIVVGGLAAWKIRRAAREARQWKLGLKGARYIGQFLQAEYLPRDYFVIHDICIQDFNIDHAVIGPHGVFAVEVKTHSKPRRGKAEVKYDGKRVLVNVWHLTVTRSIKPEPGPRASREFSKIKPVGESQSAPLCCTPNGSLRSQPASIHGC